MTRCPRCQRRLPPRGECAVHGKPSVVAATVDEPPEVVAPSGYTLGRLIAMGGSAFVYAVSEPNGAPAILKWGRWRDRDIHERFAREAEILKALGAPLTPGYRMHGAADDWPYLLMEEVTGETLATWMARTGEDGALGEIAAILLRIAHVLHAIHARGYVHRDLKPENLVIGARDTRVLDFGHAGPESEHTALDALAGTVHYLAPEQLRSGARIDRRADIYALGVIAYEMIAGIPPFVGERRAIHYQHEVARPPALREVRQVPKQFEELVLACLAKDPAARPQTAEALIEQLTQASAYIETLKGVTTASKKLLGTHDQIVLAWIDNAEPSSVVRAINDAHGIVVRRKPGALLAAFAAQFHDAPLVVALAACRELVHGGCRVVLHVTNALVRRSAQGKPAFYGPAIEKPETWLPTGSYTGLLLSAAAADLAPTAVTPAELAGFFRDAARDRTDATDADREVSLIGRDRILDEMVAVTRAGGVLIGIFAKEGFGKTRVLQALVERLRALSKRDVIALRGRRRLLGDRPDDDRLIEALGGEDLAGALRDAAERRAMLVIDDVHLFSAAAREQLLRDDIGLSRVLASRTPLFEVEPGVARRIAIELPPLPFADSQRLLRELLHPARLIPEVLLERLAIRGVGNPAMLVALARDIRHRGGIRRQPGSDDWYIAADEIDTLLPPPMTSWIASRSLDALPAELASLVRIVSALGPRFNAAEAAAAIESDAADRLRALVQHGVLAERAGWFEFADASLQDAIYEHVLEDRAVVHARVLRYWLARRDADLVGWLARLAYHATACGDVATAAASSTILAREARKRGEEDVAAELELRLLTTSVGAAPSAIADAMRAFDES